MLSSQCIAPEDTEKAREDRTAMLRALIRPDPRIENEKRSRSPTRSSYHGSRGSSRDFDLLTAHRKSHFSPRSRSRPHSRRFDSPDSRSRHHSRSRHRSRSRHHSRSNDRYRSHSRGRSHSRHNHNNTKKTSTSTSRPPPCIYSSYENNCSGALTDHYVYAGLANASVWITVCAAHADSYKSIDKHSKSHNIKELIYPQSIHNNTNPHSLDVKLVNAITATCNNDKIDLAAGPAEQWLDSELDHDLEDLYYQYNSIRNHTARIIPRLQDYYTDIINSLIIRCVQDYLPPGKSHHNKNTQHTHYMRVLQEEAALDITKDKLIKYYEETWNGIPQSLIPCL